MPKAARILIETSPGELVDKVSVLELKATRIADSAKVAAVRRELLMLEQVRRRTMPDLPPLADLSAELTVVNGQLWDLEIAIRVADSAERHGEHFVALARSIWRLNERRAELKARINVLLECEIVEVKSYTPECSSDVELSDIAACPGPMVT